jgi:hypothetical protein
VKVDAKKLIVYIPDSRGVTVSAFGIGNMKIGPSVYTYSRLPGHPSREALGEEAPLPFASRGTCPGASAECEAICYARRPVAEQGPVYWMWQANSETDEVPAIPDDCRLLRIHVGGDFSSVEYIENWVTRLTERPDVTAWAYTRSWRVAELLPALERLRALPNMQMFASMDISIPETPPTGWRRAWIDGDSRAGEPINVQAHKDAPVPRNLRTFDATMTLVCPEETKHQPNCEECGYCFKGQKNDVTFLKH